MWLHSYAEHGQQWMDRGSLLSPRRPACMSRCMHAERLRTSLCVTQELHQRCAAPAVCVTSCGVGEAVVGRAAAGMHGTHSYLPYPLSP